MPVNIQSQKMIRKVFW